MKEKVKITPCMVKVTILCALGFFIQTFTSMTWMAMSDHTIGYGDTTIGEAYMLCGQAVGEIMYFMAIRLWVVKGMLLGELLFEYFMFVVLVDIVSILFLNPYKVELYKYGAFFAAPIGYFYRLHKYIKK